MPKQLVGTARKSLTKLSTCLLLVSFFQFSNISQANALAVTATGTDPTICNQDVGSTSGVVVSRLSDGSCVVEFRTVGTNTWTVPTGVTSVSVLVVGGGGGGGSRHAGGGGGGGVVYAETFPVSGIVGIQVGGGGTGGVSAVGGTSGSDSRFFANGEITPGSTGIVAKGGGFGDFYQWTSPNKFIGRAGDGGSGGGAAVPNPFTRDLGSAPWGNTDPRGYTIQSTQTQRRLNGETLTANFWQYGSDGSQGGQTNYWAGGGGGGAGGVGVRGGGAAGTDYTGGAGGPGIQNAITGSWIYYGCGGGGGGGTNGSTNSAGGSGGTDCGGAGSSGNATASNGSTNRGGGGGGGGLAVNGTNGRGGDGGSGIVIIRFTPPCQQTYSLTGTGTISVYSDGTYCYLAFKNTGGVNTQTVFTWTRPTGVTVVDVLVVGGGGSGGARHGGGGGGGGFVQADTFTISSASTISVAVGAGGDGSTSLVGTNGQTSYFKPTSASTSGLIALGGGAGANGTAGSGGSGGGAGASQTPGSVTSQTQSTFAGVTLTGISFGSAGSAGANDTNLGDDPNDYWAGGGGGGASTAGARPTSNGTLVSTFPNYSSATAVGGRGGVGKSVNWINTTVASGLNVGQSSGGLVYFAGGGGGGMGVDGQGGGPGGLGGGATGTRTEATGNAGTAFTGGGGGGSGFDDISKTGSTGTVSAADAGDGGSGIVVIRYIFPPSISVSPTISGTTSFGQLLSSTTGTWTRNPTSYSYQWSRSPTSGGTYTNISGATSSTYTLVTADIDQFLKVTVTATNSGGSGLDTSTATIQITKARQASLTIGQYNAYPGVSTYPLNVYGGSGTGAITRSRLTAGTANCTLTGGMFITATSVGTCSVQAVKAGDTNYFAETATATIYWIQWSDAYATRVPSVPTEIVINHQTQIFKYAYDTLTVTSYTDETGTALTSIAKGATLRIYATGLATSDISTQVTFWGNESVYYGEPGFSLTSNYIQVIVPSAATTGRVRIDSAKGSAMGASLTVTG